jgi:hypothetical protein
MLSSQKVLSLVAIKDGQTNDLSIAPIIDEIVMAHFSYDFKISVRLFQNIQKGA